MPPAVVVHATRWYDSLSNHDQTLARGTPAGLAKIHTFPFAKASGQRWKLYPYLRLITELFMPALLDGGKRMLFMPPRHGKSLFSSVYTSAWYVMFWQTRNVIITSYGEDLAVGFSKKAQGVVDDLGHLFGVRVHPKKRNAKNWQVQYLTVEGYWRDGGEVFAAGVDGALPGRGGHLIVMDDVVRGHKDTTPTLMEKAYRWYRGVLETRLEPDPITGKPGAILLIMTRWAQADIAGRLLEDEPEEWETLSLPALAKEDDALGRAPGVALCPERYSAEWLIKKRDSSDEGGILFEALYQQSPIPEGGLIFQPEQLLRWEAYESSIAFANGTIARASLKLWFATIDPGLKAKELNDPTGFLVWAIAPLGELLCMEDHTARMRGSTDLIPTMHRVRAEHPGIHFFVEKQAHGTEIIRAALRQGLQVLELDADTEKVTRWIGAQPAFAARKVFLPARGANALVKELLENPGAKHDDRVDCVAYGVQVWRDRVRQLAPPAYAIPKTPAVDDHDTHPEDIPEDYDSDKNFRGHWKE